MDPKSMWSYQQMQRNLLHQAVALLQPGGALVYSTCTINPGAFRADDSRRGLAIVGVEHPLDPNEALCHRGKRGQRTLRTRHISDSQAGGGRA